ncbi:MAG: CBS domain-containing protein [Candidatus Omnitrophica bacterium]|nr:CBS domain-containing protein [Candidatus Omnitrophota bacterium]
MEANKYKISTHLSIRDAVKKMDEGGISFCVCVDDEDKVIGVFTDGDFRRAVHHGIQLDENIVKIINRDFIFVQKDYDKEDVETIFTDTIVSRIPVLDDGCLLDILSAEEFHGPGKSKKRRILDIPVVIMAGGKGTRLDPFTRILPKPLIPLGNDPVIKVIMDEFHKFGMDNFYISLNDKEKMVMAYFHDHELGYKINYIREDEPLGTAGALKFLDGKVKGTFFVSNCDIIIRTDYGAFYDFHKNGGYALTMVGSMRQYTIPYGVCEADSRGVLKAIQEKPQYDFLVNTGMYLLEPVVAQLIPECARYNMTDLIRKAQHNGLKVGIFPVSEKSWIDVGQLSEYKEIINKLSF